MSTYFDTLIAGLRASELNAWKVKSVTYHPNGGADKSLTGIFEDAETLTEYDTGGQSIRDKRLGVLRLDPATAGTISNQDSVTIDSVVWAVSQIRRRSPIVELELEINDERTVGKARHIRQRG